MNQRYLNLLFHIFLLLTLGWAAPLQAVVPVKQICPQKYNLVMSGTTLQIPCCYNHSLETRNPVIERAVIVIQGKNRTATRYFDYLSQAADKAGGLNQKTLILAPQFLIEADIRFHKLPDQMLFWTDTGWKQGDDSLSTKQHPRPIKVSSFELLDTILVQLADRTRFPNLKQIIMVGHSAGGQFVNRYAAGNRGQDVLQPLGIHIRYVVANPSSYLYFNETRRVAPSTDRFAVPGAGACPGYNRYKYGLESLNPYMARTGADRIRKQYPEREVIYLLGAEDRDPHSEDLEQSCAALIQGSQRLARGRIYYDYLLRYFNNRTAGRHKLALIPQASHNAKDMFLSACGLLYLFDFNPGPGRCSAP